MGVNFVFMIGNLTRDPETRVVPGGATVTDFGFATNETWKDEQGEKRERVCFIDVSVWGARGEAVQKYCHKGSQVAVKGRLDLERWNDRETQNPRSRHKITASEVMFLNTDAGGGGDRPRRDRGGATPGAQSARDEYRRGRDAPKGHGDPQDQRQGTGSDFGGNWNPDAQDAPGGGGGDAMGPLRERFGDEGEDIPF